MRRPAPIGQPHLLCRKPTASHCSIPTTSSPIRMSRPSSSTNCISTTASYKPAMKADILKENISTQKKIVLKYNQTNITIEYCALNYIFNNKNQYAYKLEGFDHDWNEVGNRRTAYYTNIPSGTYKFVVKGSNNDGIWNEEGTTLEIVVLPPLWKTWWAYLFYAVVAIAPYRFPLPLFSPKRNVCKTTSVSNRWKRKFTKNIIRNAIVSSPISRTNCGHRLR